MFVVLDNIRSSQNVGAIFRTAEAVGCAKIYLSGITPAPLDRFGRSNSRLLKASLGAEKYLVWEQVKSTKKLITELKTQGIKILALEQAPNSISLFDFDLEVVRERDNVSRSRTTSKFALVLGNEIKGLPSSLLTLADQIIEIPMQGRKESLNVAVAFGIAIFHLRYFL